MIPSVGSLFNPPTLIDAFSYCVAPSSFVLLTAMEAFTSAAKIGRNDFSFGVVTDAAVSAARSAAQPSCALFRKFDEPKIAMEGDITKECRRLLLLTACCECGH